jgi:hypothetical protein
MAYSENRFSNRKKTEIQTGLLPVPANSCFIFPLLFYHSLQGKAPARLLNANADAGLDRKRGQMVVDAKREGRKQ